jgi:prepilin-type N-terminal cleavage/methylation domain-containing protein
MRKIKTGFSLIELLVVIAIIGILAAIGTIGYNKYIHYTKVAANNANAATVLRAVKAAASEQNRSMLYRICGAALASAPNDLINSVTPTPHNCIASLLADMKDPFADHPYSLLIPYYASVSGPYNNDAGYASQDLVYFSFPVVMALTNKYLVGVFADCHNGTDPSSNGFFSSWGGPVTGRMYSSSHILIMPIQDFSNLIWQGIPGVNILNESQFWNSPVDPLNIPLWDGTGWALVSCDDQGNQTQVLPISNLQDWSKW